MIAMHIILCCNFPEIDDTIYDNQASKTEDSFLYQCRKLNYLLSEKSVQLNHLLLVDLVGLQNRFGVGHLFNNNIYITTDIVLSTDILPYVSEIVLNIIKVRNGIVNKCVILDLDNTLWGGVIGDVCIRQRQQIKEEDTPQSAKRYTEGKQLR